GGAGYAGCIHISRIIRSSTAAGIIASAVGALKNRALGDHMAASAMVTLDFEYRPFIETIPLGWFIVLN
ncbi:MAG: hypothetical protein O7B27_05020, partial [Gammaproteobacteria bacterium]|nr:hypothetical protein [Gammaproteobacteria bacterium]